MTLEARIEALLARAADLTDDEVRELHLLIDVRDTGALDDVEFDDDWSVSHELAHRKEMSGSEINDLPDSAFAYVEPGGKKDSDGKTTPRSLRHYPVHDEAHARNAYSRAQAQIKGNGAGKSIAQKAMPKIKAALKKFGVTIAADEKKDSGAATQSPWDESTHPTFVGVRGAACPSCGSDNEPNVVDDEMRCPGCGAYRGDARLKDPKGYNMEDGTYTGGSVNPVGYQDMTGTVSSREPKETHSACQCGEACSCKTSRRADELDTLAARLEAYLAAIKAERARWEQEGVDGSTGVDAGFGGADTPPHPTDDDDEGNEGAAQRRDPDVDQGDGVTANADSYSDAGGDSEGGDADGDDGSEPADADVGGANTPPHPENDDDAGAAQREDPNVDEGDGVDDGQAYPNEQESEPERKSARRTKARRSSTPAPKPEHRVRVSPMEVRLEAASDGGDTLRGMAIVYNQFYTVYDAFGAFREEMKPTVCDRVLSSGNLDCRFLINHDGLPLGRTTSRTLELHNGPKGLATVTHLSPNSTLAADLADAISRRDVTQMSVGFRVAEDEWDEDFTTRKVHSFSDLLDVSAVTYPASPTTSIDVAKRMLYSLPTEAREGVYRAYGMVCDVRAGSRLDKDCSDLVLRALETLYSVDDPRVPLVRVREAWKIARDVRAGKTLSASNAGFIAAALESLHRADDVDVPAIVRSLEGIDSALDDAMSALSQVSGLPNPDDDDPGVDPGEKVRRRELEIEQAAEQRKRAAKAQRDRLRVKRPRP